MSRNRRLFRRLSIGGGNPRRVAQIKSAMKLIPLGHLLVVGMSFSFSHDWLIVGCSVVVGLLPYGVLLTAIERPADTTKLFVWGLTLIHAAGAIAWFLTFGRLGWAVTAWGGLVMLFVWIAVFFLTFLTIL